MPELQARSLTLCLGDRSHFRYEYCFHHHQHHNHFCYRILSPISLLLLPPNRLCIYLTTTLLLSVMRKMLLQFILGMTVAICCVCHCCVCRPATSMFFWHCLRYYKHQDYSNLHHCLSVTCILSCCCCPLIPPRTCGSCGNCCFQQGIAAQNSSWFFGPGPLPVTTNVATVLAGAGATSRHCQRPRPWSIPFTKLANDDHNRCFPMIDVCP